MNVHVPTNSTHGAWNIYLLTYWLTDWLRLYLLIICCARHTSRSTVIVTRDLCLAHVIQCRRKRRTSMFVQQKRGKRNRLPTEKVTMTITHSRSRRTWMTSTSSTRHLPPSPKVGTRRRRRRWRWRRHLPRIILNRLKKRNPWKQFRYFRWYGEGLQMIIKYVIIATFWYIWRYSVPRDEFGLQLNYLHSLPD